MKAGHAAHKIAADGTFNAESSRESKRRRVSTNETSNEFLVLPLSLRGETVINDE